MRFLMLATLAALLASCSSSDSYVVRSKVNGHWQIDARAHVDAGVATFECVHSASGSCHFSLFEPLADGKAPRMRECISPQASTACSARVLASFSVAVDAHLQRRLPRTFRLCASHRPEAVRPDCKPLEDA